MKKPEVKAIRLQNKVTSFWGPVIVVKAKVNPLVLWELTGSAVLGKFFWGSEALQTRKVFVIMERGPRKS